MINKTSPYEFDRRVVTPEFYNNKDNIAVHVFNHLLEGQENLQNSSVFILGRLKWYAKNLPEGCKQLVKIDDRGQNINKSTRDSIYKILENHCAGVDFLSEGI